jgi:hypothetical protein
MIGAIVGACSTGSGALDFWLFDPKATEGAFAALLASVMMILS